MSAPTIEEARAACDRGAWSEACAWFTALDARHPLEADDLDRLAIAAYLVGHDVASLEVRARAHHARLAQGDAIGAARSAFWLAFALVDDPSQQAQAAGWVARARRLVDEAGVPCAERGWLLCIAGRQAAAEGRIAAAREAFGEAATIGARFREPDLIALARHGEGRCLLRAGETAAGLALLDEVMIAVAGGEIGPLVAGVVYCSVISACHDLFDLRRAQEWTTALQHWCSAHPELVPFRGYCLVRRSELLQLHGAWQDALDEARRACDLLAASPQRREAGAAYYQLGELHRLRGEPDAAEEAYRLANHAGRAPQPGLALLRLIEGRLDAAESAIRSALAVAREGPSRVQLLAAAVDILLERGDNAGARAACDEIARSATRFDSPFLKAVCAQARGAVALANGHTDQALASAREGWTFWQDLDAPYQAARARVLLGRVHQRLGDREGARLELEAAHELFERIGATADAARALVLIPEPVASATTALTGRELEVLRLIATGATNRAIAASLGISEKTIARHVSNIFTKLDLSSRAAATAYAYEHRLI